MSFTQDNKFNINKVSDIKLNEIFRNTISTYNQTQQRPVCTGCEKKCRMGAQKSIILRSSHTNSINPLRALDALVKYPTIRGKLIKTYINNHGKETKTNGGLSEYAIAEAMMIARLCDHYHNTK